MKQIGSHEVTEREWEVVERFALGEQSERISQDLGIPTSTIFSRMGTAMRRNQWATRAAMLYSLGFAMGRRAEQQRLVAVIAAKQQQEDSVESDSL